MLIQRPVFAIIPAATVESRLGRLTSYGKHIPYGPSPVSVLPVCNVPNINRHIEQAMKVGVTDFYIVESYMAGHIMNVTSYGERFGPNINVHHLVNRKPLDTAEAMRQIIEEKDFPSEQSFLMMASNISFSGVNLQKMIDAFAAAKQEHSSIAGCLGFVLRPANAILNRYGTAVVDKNNLVVRFIEKPSCEEEIQEIYQENLSHKNEALMSASQKYGEPLLPANASIYLLLREMINLAPDPELKKLAADVLPRLSKGLLYAHFLNEEINKGCLKMKWSHLASPKEYWLAQWRVMRAAPSEIPGTFSDDRKSWIGRAAIFQGSPIIENSIIGHRVRIGPGSAIRNSIIGPGCNIQAAEIERSVILPYTSINTSVYAEPIDYIGNSVVGGRVIGGTSIDSLHYSQHSLDGQLAAPDEVGNVEAIHLNLTEDDLAEVLDRRQETREDLPVQSKDQEVMQEQSFSFLTSLTRKTPLELNAFLYHPWYRQRAGEKELSLLASVAEVAEVVGSLVYQTRIEGNKVKLQIIPNSRRGTGEDYPSRAEKEEIEALDTKRRTVLENTVWIGSKSQGDFSCILVSNHQPGSKQGELVNLLVKYDETFPSEQKLLLLSNKFKMATEYIIGESTEDVNTQKIEEEFIKLSWQYLFENDATVIKDEIMRRLELKPKAGKS
ncbi:hypothetical protein AMJ44_05775 [candidate division WOR-1 bacterium DG_54_3]|uniref:Nucleotidyl transferase domain-containing protein n=1 Tax=candidate division WOR-1 bacterium DG_54_3 TaxID=1703775 RepID=A0A0S7Y248_UNCSA|nr:MAG: hypothetical protein AMJ44_05775 [candidate division WOR-1 bacterium DG_54_3]